MNPDPPSTDAALRLLRDAAPQVLGVLARRYDDFDAVEDAVQDALIAASEQWPAAGIPDNPRGWLWQVARRRLADTARSDAARRRREAAMTDQAFVPPPDGELGIDRDDTLALLFMCCHPSLTPASAIALTLRAVGGLTTAEIASAFLVPEPTMGQRISRAKQTIRESGVGFEVPGGEARAARLGAVRHVLYLMFNEGYTSSAGDALLRVDLSNEAIRLARLLHVLAPDDAETTGLLALLLLTDARRPARTGPGGELIPLDEQDRSRWNRQMVEEGVALARAARSRGAIGAYQLQAAIAALHDEAPSTAATDWRQVMALYAALGDLTDNPMVQLNHAVAAAMVYGPDKGLALIAGISDDPRIRGHYRVDAVRGHLYELAGDMKRAAEHLRAAADGTRSGPERNYLLARAARLATPGAR